MLNGLEPDYRENENSPQGMIATTQQTKSRVPIKDPRPSYGTCS
jgi:hypothetical protein